MEILNQTLKIAFHHQETELHSAPGLTVRTQFVWIIIQEIQMETIFNSSEFCKPQYDHFATQNHRKAHLVGRTARTKNPKVCDCCLRPLDKQPIDLRCDDSELSFLGTPTVLYFGFLKAALLVLAFLLLTSLLITKIYNQSFVCCTISEEFLVALKMENSGSTILVVCMWAVLCIFVILLKRYTERQIWSIQKGIIPQQMYTLKLVNLGQTEAHELKKWVFDACGEKVVELEMAYDIKEMEDTFLKREKLTQQKNKLQMSRSENEDNLYISQNLADPLGNKKEQIVQINTQITKLDSTLNKYKNCISVVPGKQAGVAFVMFESIKSRQQAKQHFEDSVKEKKEAAIFKQKVIRIERAANPKDVIWQNLNEERHLMSILLQALAYSVGVGFLLGLYYFCRTYIDFRQVRQKQLIVLASLFLVYSLLHTLAHLLVFIQAKFSRYESYTRQELASFRIYASLNTLSALVLPYLFSRSQQELILYINLTVIIDSTIHPLIKAFNFSDIYRVVLMEYIKNLYPNKNPYTQDYLNRLFEGRIFKLGQNYHYLFRALAVSSFHCFAAPLVFLYYLVGMGGEYVTQKYLLLRACKTPPKFNLDLVLAFICCLSLVPALFLSGVVVFLRQQDMLDVTGSLAIGGCLVISKGLAVYVMASLRCFNSEQETSDTYYQAKPKFGQFYQMQNPVNKYNGRSISSFLYNPEQACLSPQFSAIDLFLNEEEKPASQSKKKQIRCMHRLMSYNTEPFELQMSYQYKRLCDT